jgi:hypothetical protein
MVNAFQYYLHTVPAKLGHLDDQQCHQCTYHFLDISYMMPVASHHWMLMVILSMSAKLALFAILFKVGMSTVTQ